MKNYLCNLCENIAPEIMRKTEKYEFVKCKNCGLLYVRDINKTNDTQVIQNDFYNDYSFSSNFAKFRKEYYPKFLNSFAQKVKNSEMIVGSRFINGSRFLDIGSGGGNYLEVANELNWNSFGVEIDMENAKKANNLGLNVFCGTLQDAHYPDNYFDLIQIKQVLEHVPDPNFIIKETFRILKKGGG